MSVFFFPFLLLRLHSICHCLIWFVVTKPNFFLPSLHCAVGLYGIWQNRKTGHTHYTFIKIVILFLNLSLHLRCRSINWLIEEIAHVLLAASGWYLQFSIVLKPLAPCDAAANPKRKICSILTSLRWLLQPRDRHSTTSIRTLRFIGSFKFLPRPFLRFVNIEGSDGNCEYIRDNEIIIE